MSPRLLPARDRLESLPVVGRLFAHGAQTLGFDLLILLAPVLIALIAVFGRTPVTTALAAGYLVAFVGSIVAAVVSES